MSFRPAGWAWQRASEQGVCGAPKCTERYAPGDKVLTDGDWTLCFECGWTLWNEEDGELEVWVLGLLPEKVPAAAAEPGQQAALLAEEANRLGARLREVPPCSEAVGGQSCLRLERLRRWSSNGQGPLHLRPTQEQDPRRMCPACAALWHATMCELALRDVARAERLLAREEARVVAIAARAERALGEAARQRRGEAEEEARGRQAERAEEGRREP